MVDLPFYTSYKELYQQAPLFARKKVIKVYQETQNKSFTARVFQTYLCVVRKIIRRFEREGEEGLKDHPRRPKHSPHKTPLPIEGMIPRGEKEDGLWSRPNRKKPHSPRHPSEPFHRKICVKKIPDLPQIQTEPISKETEIL